MVIATDNTDEEEILGLADTTSTDLVMNPSVEDTEEEEILGLAEDPEEIIGLADPIETTKSSLSTILTGLKDEVVSMAEGVKQERDTLAKEPNSFYMKAAKSINPIGNLVDTATQLTDSETKTNLTANTATALKGVAGTSFAAVKGASSFVFDAAYGLVKSGYEAGLNDVAGFNPEAKKNIRKATSKSVDTITEPLATTSTNISNILEDIGSDTENPVAPSFRNEKGQDVLEVGAMLSGGASQIVKATVPRLSRQKLSETFTQAVKDNARFARGESIVADEDNSWEPVLTDDKAVGFNRFLTSAEGFIVGTPVQVGVSRALGKVGSTLGLDAPRTMSELMDDFNTLAKQGEWYNPSIQASRKFEKGEVVPAKPDTDLMSSTGLSSVTPPLQDVPLGPVNNYYLPDGNIVVANRRTGMVENPLVSPAYANRVQTAQGDFLQTPYNIFVDQLSTVKQVSQLIERNNALAEGNFSKVREIETNDINISDEYTAMNRFKEIRNTWSSRASGVLNDRTRRTLSKMTGRTQDTWDNVVRWNDKGFLEEVPDVLTLKAIYRNTIEKAGPDNIPATRKQIAEFHDANNQLADYDAIRANLEDITTDIADRMQKLLDDNPYEVFKTKAKDGSANNIYDSAISFKLAMEEFFRLGHRDEMAAYRLVPESEELLNTTRRMAELKEVALGSLKKGKTQVSKLMDEYISEASTHRPYLSYEQANNIANVKYADQEWAGYFKNEMTKFNRFLLDEQVGAGLLHPNEAERMHKANPMYAPSYKEMEKFTTVTSDKRKPPSRDDRGPSTRRREISAKENIDPTQSVIKYLQSADQSISNNRFNQTLINYFSENLDPVSWNYMFYEPLENVREAIIKAKSSDKRMMFTPQELGFNGAGSDRLTAGRTAKFHVNGSTLELTVRDQEIYHAIAGSAYINPKSIPVVSPLANFIRWTVVNEPVTAYSLSAAEMIEKTFYTPLPIKDAVQFRDSFKNLLKAELDPTGLKTFTTNYYLSGNPALERAVGNEIQRNFEGIITEELGKTTALQGVRNLPRNIRLAFENIALRGENTHRISLYEKLVKNGMPEVEAMEYARNLSVRYTQRGTGLSGQEFSDLRKGLYENLVDAKASGDAERIAAARDAYNSVSYTGKGLLVNPVTANLVGQIPFLRTNINAYSRMGSRLRYMDARAFRQMTMAATGWLSIEGLSNIGNEDYTFYSGGEEVGQRTNEDIFRKLNLGGVSIRSGFNTGSLFINGARTIGTKTAEVFVNNFLPVETQKALKKYDPELYNAISEVDPQGKLLGRAALHGIVNTLTQSTRLAVVGPVYNTMMGQDYTGAPMVDPAIDNPENPRREVMANTNPIVIELSKKVFDETGMQFSPAKLQGFINNFSTPAVAYLGEAINVAASEYGLVPERPANIKGTDRLSRTFLATGKDLFPRENAFRHQANNIWKEAKEVKADYDLLLKEIQEAESGNDEIEVERTRGNLNDFLSDPYNIDYMDAHRLMSPIVEDRNEIIKRMIDLRIGTDKSLDAPVEDRKITGSDRKKNELVEYRRILHEYNTQMLNTIKDGHINGGYILESGNNFNAKEEAILATIYRSAGKVFGGIEGLTPVKPEEQINHISDHPHPYLEDDSSAVRDITSEEWIEVAKKNSIAPEEIIDVIGESAMIAGIRPEILAIYAHLESSSGTNMGDEDSFAQGLYQISDPWWKDNVKRYGEDYNITYGDRGNSVAEGIILGAKIKEDFQKLTDKLNRYPTVTEIYAIHHFGDTGGMKFLEALNGPNQTMAGDKILPSAAPSNPNIFYPPSTLKDETGTRLPDTSNPYTVKEIYENLSNKITQAPAAPTRKRQSRG